MAVTLTTPPKTANERALAAWNMEEQTGITGTTVTLAQTVDEKAGLLHCWVNGTLVQPSTHSVSGSTLTLGSALSPSDWIVIHYKARGTP